MHRPIHSLCSLNLQRHACGSTTTPPAAIMMISATSLAAGVLLLLLMTHQDSWATHCSAPFISFAIQPSLRTCLTAE